MSTNSILSISPLQAQWQTPDPFLFCAYHNDKFPKGNGSLGPASSLAGRAIGQDFGGKDGWSMYHGESVPGFPGHPHRGFETVTIASEGMVDHSDSLGGTGRFGDGDVQWMTAGKGIQHSEMFPLIHEDKENPMLLFQIWLNLPKRSKMVEPYYGMMWHEDIPIVASEDNNGHKSQLKVIAGTFKGVNALAPSPESWAADPDNHVGIWLIELDATAQLSLPAASSEINRNLYYYRGSSLQINGETISSSSRIVVDAAEELKIENGDEKSYLLVLQGRPLNEPVAQYGPFVMNTQAEIQQAFSEYQRTQFGGWPWPKVEYTHAPEKGRFAQYVDGTIEEK